MKNPRHGGRILLELEGKEPGTARYRVTLYSPDAEWRSTASITTAEGDLTLGSWEGEGAPPDWLVDGARGHLRALFRRSAREGWPRRLFRWRRPR